MHDYYSSRRGRLRASRPWSALSCGAWPAILGGDLGALYFVLIVNKNDKGSDYLSRFTFIASDYELPEIDLSGIIKGTVKELREMNLNHRPESF